MSDSTRESEFDTTKYGPYEYALMLIWEALCYLVYIDNKISL